MIPDKQRLKIYRGVSQQLKFFRPEGLCYHIKIASMIPVQLSDFPEIWRHRPPDTPNCINMYWWQRDITGMRRRQEIIEEAIKELEEKIKD